jgi:aspartyl-tRNA synthetase
MALLFGEIMGKEITLLFAPAAFPRITYKESIERFGTDKPDTMIRH